MTFNFLQERLERLSDTRRKIAKNLCWSVAGKITNLLGNLLVGILVARYLGPEKYGILNYVISYVGLFTVISSFGLDNIEIRELAKNSTCEKKFIGTVFAIRAACALFACVLAVIGLLVQKHDQATTVLIAMYVSTLFLGCTDVFRNYFTAKMESEYVAKSEMARSLIGAAIKIALLLIHAQLYMFVIALVVDAFLLASGYVLNYKWVGRTIKYDKFDFKLAGFLLRESFPLLLSGAAVVLYQRIDQVIIVHMLDAERLGYYATACRLTEPLMFVSVVIIGSITPVLVKLRDVSVTKYESVRFRFMAYSVWSSIVMALGLSLFSQLIVKYTFGSGYSESAALLRIMAWKIVGASLAASSGQLIIIEGIQKWAVFRNIVSVLLCVLLNMGFIPAYGVIGSAWASVITAISAGMLANILIGPYHSIFKLQLKVLTFVWYKVWKA